MTLSVVAFPKATLQTVRDPAKTTFPLFAKVGLLFRAGTAFDLDIAPEFVGVATMGWDRRAGLTYIHIPACEPVHAQTPWFAYPGGFEVQHVACITVIVTVGQQTQRIQLGVGTACPGQSPPPEPSQT